MADRVVAALTALRAGARWPVTASSLLLVAATLSAGCGPDCTRRVAVSEPGGDCVTVHFGPPPGVDGTRCTPGLDSTWAAQDPGGTCWVSRSYWCEWEALEEAGYNTYPEPWCQGQADDTVPELPLCEPLPRSCL